MTQNSNIGPRENNVDSAGDVDERRGSWFPAVSHDGSSGIRDCRLSYEGYKGLIVWQRAIEMVDAVYDLTRGFPALERLALSDQMRRSAISVPSNIAEGYGRSTTGEFKQFLGFARGSNCELETQIIISKRRAFGAPEALLKAENLNCEVGRMLNAYMKSVGK